MLFKNVLYKQHLINFFEIHIQHLLFARCVAVFLVWISRGFSKNVITYLPWKWKHYLFSLIVFERDQLSADVLWLLSQPFVLSSACRCVICSDFTSPQAGWGLEAWLLWAIRQLCVRVCASILKSLLRKDDCDLTCVQFISFAFLTPVVFGKRNTFLSCSSKGFK